jgi:hypothetical protein
LRVRNQPVARMLLDEAAQGLLRQRVILALDIAVTEIVFVLRRG